MALFRAMETARPARARLFDDPFAPLFLTPGYALLARLAGVPAVRDLVERIVDGRVPGARTSAIARTRLIDDLLRRALPDVEQLVILGAGYDCRAYRIPELARHAVFELDHPDTLAAKRRRLAADIRGNVGAVAIDFDRERAGDALASAGHDPRRPTFFLWEGVTNYLAPAAVDATLRWVGGAAPGSVVVFTYVERRVLEDPRPFHGAARLLQDLARLGEPWTFGLDPAEVGTYLAARGLTLVEDVGAAEYRRRYLADRRGGMRGYEFYRVAAARVSNRTSCG
jgi:methyltransferase (TIGR00027 family)